MSKKMFFCVLLILVTASLFAGGESMPWDTGLDKIQKALSGNTVKVIGFIMIIGAGVALAFTEGQAIKKVFWIVIGLGVAANAASFGTMLMGSGSGFLLRL